MIGAKKGTSSGFSNSKPTEVRQMSRKMFETIGRVHWRQKRTGDGMPHLHGDADTDFANCCHLGMKTKDSPDH